MASVLVLLDSAAIPQESQIRLPFRITGLILTLPYGVSLRSFVTFRRGVVCGDLMGNESSSSVPDSTR